MKRKGNILIMFLIEQKFLISQEIFLNMILARSLTVKDYKKLNNLVNLEMDFKEFKRIYKNFN